MPLDPKKTKNGVDLNELDVSALTLVDKKNLIDELSKRLTETIHDAFQEGIDATSKDLADMMKGRVSSGNNGGATGTSNGHSSSAPAASGGGSRPPKPPSDDSSQEFEKLRKIEANVRKQLEKIRSDQKKKNQQTRSDQLKGNVYSAAGQRSAGGINEIAGDYQNYSSKELAEAKERLSDIHENVKMQTVGKESKILTDATLELQKALDGEIKKRTTVLGKLGESFTKQNINLASIITGFASHSPLAGIVTKYMFDTIREHKEDQQKKKSDRLKVADLKKTLPHPDEPIIDDKDTKIDNDVARKNLGAISDPDVRHGVLENLHDKGEINTQQLQNLHVENLSPTFQPYWEKLGQGAPPRQTARTTSGQSTVASPTPVLGQNTSSSPTPAPLMNNMPGLIDDRGNPVKDWQNYIKNTSKKKRKDDEMHGWLDVINQRGIGLHEERHQERLKQPRPAWHKGGDDELFGDFYAEPSALAHAKKRAARYKAQAPDIATPESNVERMPMQMAASPEGIQEHNIVDGPHPERMSNDPNSSLRNLMEAVNNTEKDEDQKISILSSEKEGPLSKIERIDQDQLEELKKINKNLERQIEQADADAAARDRSTKDQGMQNLAPDIAGTGKKKGGIGGMLSGLLEGVAGGGLGGMLLGGAKKMLGIGGKGEEGGGFLAKLFGRGSNVAKGVGEGVEGAEGLGAAAKGAEGLGAAGKGAEVVESVGMLGKIGSLGKLAGKLALPLAIITSLIDFFQGFVNAEEFLGMGKKLSIMDRVAGGLGGIVKGLGGIVDMFFGFFDIKTDLGGILGTGAAKVFQSIFKALGSFFNILMAVFKPIMAFLGPIIEFIGKRLGKLFEIIGEFFDGLSKYYDGISDIIEGKSGGFEKIIDGIKEMFTAIGKWLLAISGLDFLKDAFDSLKENFSGLFDSISDTVSNWYDKFLKKPIDEVKNAIMDVFDTLKDAFKDWIGEDNYKMITDTMSAVKDMLLHPINWFKEHVLGQKVKNTKPPLPTTGPMQGPLPTTGPMQAPAPTLEDKKISSDTKSQYQPTPVLPPQPSTTTPAPVSPEPTSRSEYAKLGAMSAKGESGGNPGTTNFDRDGGKYATQQDRGGRSYGLYQITTGNENLKNGISMQKSTMVPFLKYLGKNYPDLASQLEAAGGIKGAYDGDPRFVATWKQLAKNDPRFANAQHEFIGKSAYDPLKKNFLAKGLDLDKRSDTVKRMIFEAGVGGVGNATGDFEKAFKGMSPDQVSKLSDAEIVTKYQSVRGSRYKDANVGKRFEKEKQTMLAELGRPELQGGTPAVPTGIRPQPPLMANNINSQTLSQEVQTPQLTTDSPGMVLTQVNTANAALNRQANGSGAANSIVSAPTTTVNNNNTTVATSIKAKNTDTAYERQQNLMFVPT